jgi:hypothetical protein
LNSFSENIKNCLTIISIGIIIVITLILVVTNQTFLPKFIAIFSSLFALLSIYHVKDNIYLLPFIIFNFIFTTPGIYFFLFDIEISVYKDFYDRIWFFKHSINHLIFNFSLFVLSRFSKKNIEPISFPNRPNKIKFIVLAVICICITTFSLKGLPALLGGKYGNLNKSVLYEYYIVFHSLLLYYGKRNSSDRYIIYLATLYYISKSVLFGSGIEVLYVLLLSFYTVLGDQKKFFKNSRIIILSILGYFVSTIFGKLRGNPFVVNELIGGDFSSILIKKGQRVLSTEGDVFYSSTRIIGVIEKLGLDFLDRIGSFLTFLLTTIIPRRYLPEYADLALFKKEIYPSGGGGSIISYFYVWFSFIGILILIFILKKLYNTLVKTQNDYIKLYLFMVLVTFPRWYAYNPIILIKLCLSVIPLAIFFNIKHSINR